MSPNSPVPESAVYKDGKLNENKVYIGRVYDGKCLLIGTAIPEKRICIYLNKNNEVKSSSTYEVPFINYFVNKRCSKLNLL